MYEFPQTPTNNNPKIQCLSGNSHWMAGFFWGGIMRICSINGCDRKHVAKGFCQKHYFRLRNQGDPNIVLKEHHGYSRTDEYHVWQTMKTRCLNETNKAYKYYGSRGIKICFRWQNSFMAFYEDMRPKPFSGAEIDRIDNDGNYEPGNCRWATRKMNVLNSRSTKLNIEIANEIRKIYEMGKFTQKSLAIKYDLIQSTISNIINKKIWI